jgi:hypothetical protein
MLAIDTLFLAGLLWFCVIVGMLSIVIILIAIYRRLGRVQILPPKPPNFRR